MEFIPLEIPEVLLIRPRIHKDARGAFYEGYRKDLFAQAGISDVFVQNNFSVSQKGTLRGLHYQAEPKAQAKLICVLRGSVLDVAVDIRPGSKTFGKHVAYVLKASSRELLFIPRGFAHGFLALEDETEFMYQVSDYYSPEHDRGLLWNDPEIGIDWGKTDMILSEKDKKHPALRDVFKTKT